MEFNVDASLLPLAQFARRKEAFALVLVGPEYVYVLDAVVRSQPEHAERFRYRFAPDSALVRRGGGDGLLHEKVGYHFVLYIPHNEKEAFLFERYENMGADQRCLR